MGCCDSVTDRPKQERSVKTSQVHPDSTKPSEKPTGLTSTNHENEPQPTSHKVGTQLRKGDTLVAVQGWKVLPQDMGSQFVKKIELNGEIFISKHIRCPSYELAKEFDEQINQYMRVGSPCLMPIHQKRVFLEHQQVVLRLPFYSESLGQIVKKGSKISWGQRLIMLMRLARTLQLMASKGIHHDKLQAPNIFVGKGQPVIGLPKCNSRATSDLIMGKKSIQQDSFTNGFQKLARLIAAGDQNKQAEVESLFDGKPSSLKQYASKIYSLSWLDTRPVIEENENKKIVTYQDGSKYQGGLEGQDKQGIGIMKQKTDEEYWGEWQKDKQHGRGSYSSPALQYVGEWANGFMEGQGILKRPQDLQYYQGKLIGSKKEGEGLWQGPQGDIYQGHWVQDQQQGKGTYYCGSGKWFYAGQWKSNAKNGNGRQVYSDGAVYEGSFTNNIKQGLGAYYFTDGRVYTGQFKANIPEGKGKFVNSDQSVYEGQVVNCKYHGQGTFTTHFQGKKGEYTGQWKQGVKHGKGRQVIEGVDRVEYQGDYIDGIREGKGRLVQKGETYVGELKAGQVTGKGEYWYSNGDRYEGSFVRKIKSGWGKYTSAQDGSIYEGEWDQDLREGNGKYTFKSGAYYQGYWKASQRHGKGTLHHDETHYYTGEWQNDKQQGHGVQVEGEGVRYEGKFVNGFKEGPGVMTFANGDRYEGNFEHNMQHGQGLYLWKNGDQYIGQWQKNDRHGLGTFKTTKGAIYEGEWVDNKKFGKGKETLPNGTRFEGQYANDQRNGEGTEWMKGQEGYRFEGTWKNNLKHGSFMFFFPDGESEGREYKHNVEVNLAVSNINA